MIPDRDTNPGEAAIEWLIHLGSGHATSADRQAFLDWRRRDPANEAAAIEAEAVLSLVGRTRTAADFRQVRTARLTRRAFLGGAVAASGAAIVLGSGVFGPVARLYADHSTGVGERRRIALADGSAVHLNTATAISVAYTAQSRHVHLHDGEALFEIAPDSGRPFAVTADKGEVSTDDGAFALRRAGGEIAVMVRRETAELRYDGARTAIPAGMRVIYRPDGAGRPEPADIDALTAWQRGKLVFNRRPLAEVVAEAQRYRAGRIVIAEEKLRSLEVSGIFDIDAPDQLLRAISRTVSARIVELPLLTVIA